MQTSVGHWTSSTCWSTRWRGSIGCIGCWWRCILIITTSRSTTSMIGEMWIMAVKLMMMLAVMMTVWYWRSWLRCLCSLSLCIATWWGRRWLMKEINFIACCKTDTCAWYSGCAATAWKEHFATTIGRTMYWTRGARRCGVLEDGSTWKTQKKDNDITRFS